MLDLQWDIVFVAVDTLTAPFFQEVFPDFVPGESALLVLDAGDFGVL